MLTSVKSLLSSIVDYAGLFPPAKLSLQEAMQQYAQYRRSANAWMLDRFVLPISRLSEFAALLPTFSISQSPLSIILTADSQGASQQALKQQLADLQTIPLIDSSITALEIPPLSPEDIEKLLPHLPTGIEPFFEIPLTANLDAYLTVLKGTGVAAKIRTGGITAAAFPKAIRLAQWILALAQVRLPFKATAGLHHALPSIYPITYKLNSPSTQMHGFLNVTILAALAYCHRITLEEALTVLQASDPHLFHVTPTGLIWNNHSLDLCEIETVRKNFFRSFGSCSFREPIDELRQLQWLNSDQES
jgi:hypothetical protein